MRKTIACYPEPAGHRLRSDCPAVCASISPDIRLGKRRADIVVCAPTLKGEKKKERAADHALSSERWTLRT